MTADSLRTLSRRAFKAMIYCGIVGILIVMALPTPGPEDVSPGTLVRVLAISGFSLVGIALLLNVISLVTGAIAWNRGAGSCWWIAVAGIVLLIPIVLLMLIFI